MNTETLKMTIEFVQDSANSNPDGFDALSFFSNIPTTFDSSIILISILVVLLVGAGFLAFLKYRKNHNLVHAKTGIAKHSGHDSAFKFTTSKKSFLPKLVAVFIAICLLFLFIFSITSIVANQNHHIAHAGDTDSAKVIAHVKDDGSVDFDKLEINNLATDTTQAYDSITVNRLSYDYDTKWNVQLDGYIVYCGVSGKQVTLNPAKEVDPGQSVTLSLSSSLTGDQAKSLVGTSPIEVSLQRQIFPYAFYDVDFDMCEHGSPVASQLIKYGHLVDKPEDPVEPCYTFKGWYKDSEYSEAWDFANDHVIDNVTLYAKWEPNKDTEYTVNMYFEGIGDDGMPSGDYSLYYSSKKQAVAESEVVVTAKDETGFITPESQTIKVKGDGSSVVDFYYDRKCFQLFVDYFKVGQTSPWHNIINTYAYDYHYSVDSPYLAGYTADQDVVSGTLEKETHCNVYYTENEDVTLYYYAMQYGTVSLSSEKIAPSSGKPQGSTAVADAGCSFEKWTRYNPETGQEEFYSSDAKLEPARNIEGIYEKSYYIAHFKVNENTFTLQYSDGGECTSIYNERSESLSFSFTVKSAESLTQPIVKEGYECVGWSSTLGGSLEYEIGSELSVNIADSPKTIYPVWRVKSFDVTFDLSGKGESITIKANYGEKVKKPDPDPSSPGYTFAGWYKDESCSTLWNFDTDTVYADTTIWAKWDAKTYTATFLGNWEGTSYSESVTETFGSKYTLPTKNPERVGYTFSSWNTKADGSGETIDGTSEYNVISDTFVYAQWSAIQVTCTFNWNYGLTPRSEDIDQTYDQPTTLPTDTPTREGYKFTCWNAKQDGTGDIVNENTIVKATNDYTVYAQYNELLDMSVGTITINHTDSSSLENDGPSDDAKTVTVALFGQDNDNNWHYLTNTVYSPSTTDLCDIETKQIDNKWVSTVTPKSEVATFQKIENTYKKYWVAALDKEQGYVLDPVKGDEISTTKSPNLTLNKTHSRWNMTYSVSADTVGSSSISTVDTKVTYYVGWTNDESLYQTFQVAPKFEKIVNSTKPGEAAITEVWSEDTDTSHIYPPTTTSRLLYYTCEVAGFNLADGTYVKYDDSCPFNVEIDVSDGTSLPIKSGGQLQAVSCDTSVTSPVQKGTMGVKVTSKSYNVEFETNCAQKIAAQSWQYGSKINQPEVVNPGYELEGWYLDSAFQNKWDFNTNTVKGDMKLYAKWTSGTSSYKVNHYKYKGGSTTPELVDTEQKPGTTGSHTDAKQKDYAGYLPQDFQQQIIKGDGTTEVNIYYDELKCTLHYLSSDNTKGSVSLADETIYRETGTPAGSDATPLEGCVFSSWIDSQQKEVSKSTHLAPPKNSETNVYDDSTYTACFSIPETTFSVLYNSNEGSGKTKTDSFTEASLKHDFEASDGSWIQTVSKKLKGWSLSQTSETVTYYPGDTISIYSSNPSIELFGVWEESLYTVKFDVQGHGEAPPDQLHTYGELVSRPDDPQEQGYDFEGWFSDKTCAAETKWDFDNNRVTNDLTLYAKWVPRTDTEYKINTLLEGMDKDGQPSGNCFLYDTAVKQGTTDQEIEISPVDINGFRTPDKQTVVIKGDGSTEVDFYYNRNTYLLTINYTQTSGVSVFDKFEHRYAFGYHYSVESPEQLGYSPNIETVQGTLDKDSDWDVVYSENEDVLIEYVAGTNGTTSISSEKVAPVTGSPKGCTASPNDGCEFIKWTKCNLETGEEEDFSTDLSIKPAKSSEGLYEKSRYKAYFKISEHSYTLNYSDGTETKSSYTASVAELSHNFEVLSAEALSVPITKEGYECIGWSNNAEGSIIDYQIGTQLTIDFPELEKTIYPVWRVKILKVTFDLTEAQESASTYVDYGETVKRPVPDPEYPGFTFKGWYEDTEGIQPWDFDNHKIYADITIFAKWEGSTYHATFKGNFEGSEYSQSVEEQYKSNYKLPEVEPERSGYSFIGWNTLPDGTGDKITTDSIYLHNSDTSVYAQWQGNKIKATFDWNYEGGKKQVIEQTYASTTILPKEQPTQPGHVFVCWNTKPDGTGDIVDEKTIVQSVTDYTVYAQYNELLDMSVSSITINHTDLSSFENGEPSDMSKTVCISLFGKGVDENWHSITTQTYSPDTKDLCDINTVQEGDKWISTITPKTGVPTFNQIEDKYSKYWVVALDKEQGYILEPETGAEISKDLAPELILNKDHSTWEMSYKVNADTAGESAISTVDTKITYYVGWNNDPNLYQTFQIAPKYETIVNSTAPGDVAKTDVWALDTDSGHTYPDPQTSTHPIYYRCNIVGFNMKDGSYINYDESCPFSAEVKVEDGTTLHVKDVGEVQALSYDPDKTGELAQKGKMNVNVASKTCQIYFETFCAQTVETQSVQYGGKITQPQVENPGFKLDGWYSDPFFWNIWDFDNDTVQGDMWLYAKWSQAEVKYTVNHIKIKGTSEQEIVCTQTLYGLPGEYTEAKPNTYNGYKVDKFSQQIISIDGSTTVNITYTERKCTMLYKNSNPGLGVLEREREDVYCETGTPLGCLATPTEGYSVHWKSSSGEEYDNPLIPKKDTEQGIYVGDSYSAYFTISPVDYSITYDSNVDPEQSERLIDSYTSESLYYEFTVKDYWRTETKMQLDYWSTSKDNGEGTKYYPGDKLKLERSNPSIVLYAHWKEAEYTVTFDTQGKGKEISPQTVGYNGRPIEPNRQYAEGSYIEGWYTEPEYKTKWDFAEDRVVEDITLYAKWEKLGCLYVDSGQWPRELDSCFKPVFKTGTLPDDLIFFNENSEEIQKTGEEKTCYQMADLKDAYYFFGTSPFSGYSSFSYPYDRAYDTSETFVVPPGLNSSFMQCLNQEGITSVVCDGCENNSFRQTTDAPTLNGISLGDIAKAYSLQIGAWSPCATNIGGTDYGYYYDSNKSEWTTARFISSKSHLVKKDFNCCNITGWIDGISPTTERAKVCSATVQFVSKDQTQIYASTTTDDEGNYHITVPAYTEGLFVVSHPSYDKLVEEEAKIISKDVTGYNLTLGVGKHTLTIERTDGIKEIRDLQETKIGDTLEVVDGGTVSLVPSYKTTQRFGTCEFSSETTGKQYIQLKDGCLTTPQITSDATISIKSIGNLVVKLDEQQAGDDSNYLWYHPSFTDQEAPSNIDFYHQGTKIEIVEPTLEPGSDATTEILQQLGAHHCDGYVIKSTEPTSLKCYTTVDVAWDDFVTSAANSYEEKIYPTSVNEEFENKYLTSTGSCVETFCNSSEDGWYCENIGPTTWSIPTLGGAYYTSTNGDGFYDIYKKDLSECSDCCFGALNSSNPIAFYYDKAWSCWKWNYKDKTTKCSAVLSKEFTDSNHVSLTGFISEWNSECIHCDDDTIRYVSTNDYHDQKVIASTVPNDEGYYKLIVRSAFIGDNECSSGSCPSSNDDGGYLDFILDSFVPSWGDEKIHPKGDIFQRVHLDFGKELIFNMDSRAQIVDLEDKHLYSEPTRSESETCKFRANTDESFNFRVKMFTWNAEKNTYETVYGLSVHECKYQYDRSFGKIWANINHVYDNADYDYYSLNEEDISKFLEGNISLVGNLISYPSTQIQSYSPDWQEYIWYHPYWTGVNYDIPQYVSFYKNGKQITVEPTSESYGTVTPYLEADGVYVEALSSPGVESSFGSQIKFYGTFLAGSSNSFYDLKGTKSQSGATFIRDVHGFEDIQKTEKNVCTPNRRFITDGFVNEVLNRDGSCAQIEEIDNLINQNWLCRDWESKEQEDLPYKKTEPLVAGNEYMNGVNGFYDLYYGVDSNTAKYAKNLWASDIDPLPSSTSEPTTAYHQWMTDKQKSLSENINSSQGWGSIAYNLEKSEPKEYYKAIGDYYSTSVVLSKTFCNDQYRIVTGSVYDKDNFVCGNENKDKWYEIDKNGKKVDFTPYKSLENANVKCTYIDYDGIERTMETTTNSNGVYTLVVPKHAVDITFSYGSGKTLKTSQTLTTSDASCDEYLDVYLENASAGIKPLGVQVDDTWYNFYPVFADGQPPAGYSFYYEENYEAKIEAESMSDIFDALRYPGRENATLYYKRSEDAQDELYCCQTIECGFAPITKTDVDSNLYAFKEIKNPEPGTIAEISDDMQEFINALGDKDKVVFEQVENNEWANWSEISAKTLVPHIKGKNSVEFGDQDDVTYEHFVDSYTGISSKTSSKDWALLGKESIQAWGRVYAKQGFAAVYNKDDNKWHWDAGSTSATSERCVLVGKYFQ